MSEFKIEKVRFPLEITLATDERLSATVFLEPTARHHSGPQDPRELLNDAEPFFPVVVGGRVIIVAKDQIKLVRYGKTKDIPGVLPQVVDVKVMLSDGSVVEGGVEVEQRSDAQRLLDHLNAFEGRFLSMVAVDRTAHCLVSRKMIVGVQQR